MQPPTSNDVLPDRGKPGRRDPWWRTLLLVCILAFIVGSVAAAGWVLARPQTRTAAAAGVVEDSSSTSSSTTTVRTATDVSSTSRQTIAATGQATIPDDLSLPHENDPDWNGANLQLEDCAQQVPRTPDGLNQATDVRTIQFGSTESKDTVRSETLAIAADDNAAAALYSAISSLLTTCTGGNDALDDTAPADGGDPELPSPTYATATVAPLPEGKRSALTDWTQATLIADTFPQQDSPTESQYVLIAQTGRAVIVGVAGGPAIPAPANGVPDAATVASLQSFADAMAPQLCRFTAHGCTAPSAAPVAFPQGSLLMPDGNVRLPDGTLVHKDGSPVPTMTPTTPGSQPGPDASASADLGATP